MKKKFNTTRQVFIAVAHEYQTLNENGEWSEIELRANNERELPTGGEEMLEAVQRYHEQFDPRIGTVTEHEFGFRFEGIYGYRWRDIGYRMRSVTEETTIEYRVEEQS